MEPKSDRIDGEFPDDDDEQDKHYDRGWMALFHFTEKRHILFLIGAIFFAILSGLVVPLMAVVMGKIFGSFASFGAEKINSEGLVAQVTSQIIVLAALGAGSWVVSAAFFAGWLSFGELQAKVAREKLFEGLVDKDMEWYDLRKSGVAGLMSRVQTQIKELQTAVSQPLGFSIQAMVTTVVCLIVAMYTCWSLTLVILIGLPLALGFLAVVSSRIQVHIDTQREHLSEATRTANRAFTAIEIVKAFNGQSYERNIFAKAVAKAAEAYREQAHANAMIIGFIRLTTLSMFVQGFWYGSRLVRRGQASAEDVMTTFWSCLMATQSLELILPQMILLEKGRAAGAGLKALSVKVERGRRVFNMKGGTVPKKCEGEIEIRDLSFAYPSRPGQLALDKASFFLPSHETTFIIGKSGSGKSTLGNLILKAYKPLSGSIALDGNPLQCIDSEWLRKNVTLVQQQTVLFNETIFRNIAFGRNDYENATREQVRESCRMSMLEDTLHGFPLGSDTIVGVGGIALSGGQRQRVALARAIIQNAPVLVLDEATSALDYVSRSRIMDEIHTWRKGKTTIIITHDIAQIEPEDFVYVLEQGKVVQDGYRSDLEHKSGPFQAFVKASDTKERGRKQSLIPELEPGYESEDDTSVIDCMEKGSFGIPLNSFESSTTDLESLLEDKRSRRKRQVSFLPLMGVEMVHLPGSKIRVKQRSNRRLNGKLFRSDQFPSTLETDKEDIVPATPRRKPVRSFESKEINLRQILATTWPSLSPAKRFLLVIGFAAASLHAAATPVFSFALAQLLRSFFEPKHPPSESTKWSLVVLGIAFVDGINSYLVHYLLESVAQSWVDALRIKSLTRILGQPRVWFDENPVGAISEDLEKNAEEMKNLLGRFAGYAFIGFVMILVGTIWSFAVSWELTIVGLCIAPVIYSTTRGFTWVSDKWERKSNDAAEIVGAVFEETITNIRTVRALALERYFRQKYAGATQAASMVGMKRSVLAGIGFGLADSTIMFASALIFWYGAVLVAKDTYSLGDILTVFTLLLFSLAGANTIAGFIPQISNSKDTARRVLRLYKLPRNSHESHGARRLDYRGAISFRGVNFTYPTRPDAIVLRNFNLDIAAGECVALVGVSGSGKSTLAVLLQRLYCHSEGMISIDGCPLQNFEVCSLRSQMAIVPQSSVLFGTSVHNNISYGGGHTRWEVERAARAAGIHEFITSLPDEYNTHLGDNGSHLSGGQAQRIVIARALVRNPTILILDECTSNLDSESTRVIQETINYLLKAGEASWKKMTVIIITHSQEMMQFAERIIVLSHGEVVESGAFEELLEREGELYRLLSRDSD